MNKKRLIQLIREQSKILLKENPDHLLFNGQSLRNSDSDVYTFGYYIINEDGERKFLIDKVDYHGRLVNKNIQPNGFMPRRGGLLGMYNEDFDVHDGRFWLKRRVISVWGGINKKDLDKLIKDIYRTVSVKITDDWYIEVKNNKFKKIGEYLGHHKMKYADPATRHLQSPLYKEKQNVKDFGSDKYDKLAQKMKYDNTAQMNYYHKNHYTNYKAENKDVFIENYKTGKSMKITKRQLIKIIKENLEYDKRKLLSYFDKYIDLNYSEDDMSTRQKDKLEGSLENAIDNGEVKTEKDVQHFIWDNK